MIYTFFFKVYLILLHLIVPGTGLVAIGKWKSAFFLQGGLLLCLIFLCWTRLIFEPIAIKLYLLIIVIVYITGITLISMTKNNFSFNVKRLVLQPLSFVVFSSAIFIFGFIFKDKILGIHINFVPSMSMYPTLKPGQFILIDTWAYNNNPPKFKDVIVFNKKNVGVLFVKRISEWPSGKLIENNLNYVLGDYPQASRDSRSFGGIATENILGKVNLILFTYSPENHWHEENILSKVH